MTWYEIAIIVLAAGFVAGVVLWQIIRKKKGKGSGCCDCGCCSRCGNCPSRNDAKK